MKIALIAGPGDARLRARVFEDSATGRTVGDGHLERIILGNLAGAEFTDPLRLWGDDLPSVDELAQEIKAVLENPSRQSGGSNRTGG